MNIWAVGGMSLVFTTFGYYHGYRAGWVQCLQVRIVSKLKEDGILPPESKL